MTESFISFMHATSRELFYSSHCMAGQAPSGIKTAQPWRKHHAVTSQAHMMTDTLSEWCYFLTWMPLLYYPEPALLDRTHDCADHNLLRCPFLSSSEQILCTPPSFLCSITFELRRPTNGRVGVATLGQRHPIDQSIPRTLYDWFAILFVYSNHGRNN